ncbi:CheR family methyltransferase [Leptolyngbya sp. AN03gr2]|uniref:CheR family methyltransferase n=1 Tax=unclassified Leptolyngbya TaxID=2650499 RepID=UPI003D3232B2
MSIPPFDFEYLRRLVQEQSGVVLEPHKDYLAVLHLERVSERAGYDSMNSFIEHLKRSSFSDLHLQAIEALVINETSFFRDRDPFEILRSSVFPTLIQSRSSSRAIHIWCAACSTGQEPYSIAMLIREAFPELATWTIRLIATDFSKQALDRAQQGIYTNLEISRGLPSNFRDRYFRQVGRSWQISSEIRKMVEFQELNLIQPWNSLPPMDIIFLRNVLIYFDLETKRSVFDRVQQTLQPDGYLFLGGGETTLYLNSRFETIQTTMGLYHRLRSA